MANRALVRFAKQPAAADLDAVRVLADADDVHPIGSSGYYLVHSRSHEVGRLMTELAQTAGVFKVQPDYVHAVAGAPGRHWRRSISPHRSLYFAGLPDDNLFEEQWDLHNTGQYLFGDPPQPSKPGADINAAGGWAYTTGSRNVVVADVDTGMEYDHPDLAGNVWLAPYQVTFAVNGAQFTCPAGNHGFSGVAGAMGCDPNEYDQSGHGTAVAGIMGAVGNNEIGISGVAWNISMMPLRGCVVNNQCFSSDLVNAIFAGSLFKELYGLDRFVMNYESAGDDDSAVDLELENAEADGILVITATGNECNATADFPAATYSPYALAVGASDQNDDRAYWNEGDVVCSNLGQQVFAPGWNDWATAPQPDKPHDPSYVGINDGDGSCCYAAFNGTSGAAAIAAGAAGLLLSACPLPAPDAAQALIRYADQVSSLPAGHGEPGLRIDVGSAIQECASGSRATGQIRVHLFGQGTGFQSDQGYVQVTIEGNSVYYNYDTSVDTTDTIGEALAGELTGTYTTATYAGNGVINLTTNTGGPLTNWEILAKVVDQCTRDGETCDPPPYAGATNFSGGR